jgi:DNA invertase Pin-like site-specific DNA recombinase
MRPAAYSYIRFSTPEQARGDSFRRQSEKAAAWTQKHSYEIVDTLADLGVSGYRGKNAQTGRLADFLALVEAGKITQGSVLIIESLDRFSRNTVREVLPDFLKIINAGVGIVTLADERLYTKESVDNDNFQLLASLIVMTRAHEESQRKGERVAAAWQNKRDVARLQPDAKLTVKAPEWLEAKREGTGKNVRRSFETRPERVAVVRRIFRETVEGYGRRSIARRLNEAGVNPFRGKKGWQPSSVAKLLSSRTVLGEYQPCKRDEEGERIADGKAIKGYYPAIIDQALFDRAAAAVAARTVEPVKGQPDPRSNASGRPDADAANLIRGLARCVCGARMEFINKGKPPKGGRYYVCAAAVRNAKCARRRLWKWQTVERALQVQLGPEGLQQLFVPVAEQDHSAEEFERGLERLKRMHGKLLDELLANEDPRRAAALRERETTLLGEVAALEKVRHVAAQERRRRPDLPAIESAFAAMRDFAARLSAAGEGKRVHIRRVMMQQLRTAFAEIRFLDHEIQGLIPLPGKPGSLTGPFGMPRPIEVKKVGNGERWFLKHTIYIDDPQYLMSITIDDEAPPKELFRPRYSDVS